MKTLSFRQPWASLIAAGIKDVENRTWNTNYRGRILIHASGRKLQECYTNNVLEYDAAMYNHIIFGNIEDTDKMPVGYIIGYADIIDCTDNSKSVWAERGCYHIQLANAHVFDNPIPAKGKLNLWDFPDIDENNLPTAHKVELKLPVLNSRTLTIPIIADTFCEITEGCDFSIQPDPSTCQSFITFTEALVTKNNYKVAQIDTVRFVCNDKSKTLNVKEIKQGILSEPLDDGTYDDYLTSSNYSDGPVNIPLMSFFV